MFPLVVSEGVLTVDEDMDEVWCLEDENRTHPILDAVGKEVDHLFPEEIARKLRNGNGNGTKKTSAA
jgi:hypothetical protein